MFDIIVPTYNRPKDIEKFIAEIQKQEFKDFHVFIVDDCGVEPIEQLVPKNDPHFTYIRLPENKGQAFARNIAIKKGVGQFIVSLDDDAWFESPSALGSIKEYFNNYPKLGCLMFDVKTPGDVYLSEMHHIENDGDLIGSHIACGCIYSREAIEAIGAFGGYLHSYAEETDVSLKLIAKGFEIRFAKKIKVFHNYLPGVRSKKWYRMFRYNTTRNDLMIVMMRYPFRYVFPYLFGKYFSHIIYSFKNKRDRFIAGIYTILAFPAALFKLNIIMHNRSSLTVQDFKKWIKVRW